MIATRLTEFFGIEHPIISAPMAGASGGALAAAVTGAGGLGLIGGGYGDADWIEAQFTAAGNARVGCGMITWRLAQNPELLDQILDHAPASVFLSFGELSDFAAKIRAADVPLIAQVQTLEGARQAVDAGAQIIAAQGSEAGGHGGARATFTLVPEVADYLANNAPKTLLLAAGGIADGRGLAASLALGADGALVGSRFWASKEALVAPEFHAAALAATGDQTRRSNAPDIARGLDWPAPFTIRVLGNAHTESWHENPAQITDQAALEYRKAIANGDARFANAIVGEAVGLIHDLPSAGEIVSAIVQDAAQCIQQSARCVK
ncbi:MAG: NAD(P)H-dependent flavin oxidoreductase [Paracoccaceae bacterium]